MTKTRKSLIYYFKYSHNWVFETGTRCIELFNSFGLVLFALTILINNEVILKLPSYGKFAVVTPPSYWGFMILLGLLCLIATGIPTLRANQFSGILMMISAICWAIIAVTFTLDIDDITTAPIIYGLISFFCSLTGIRLLLKNRELEELINNKYNK